MKKTVFILVLLMLAGGGFPVENAEAIGLGAYLTAAAGSLDAEDDRGRTVDNDFTLAGLGFVMDTAVAKNRLFNYRLKIGYERQEYDGSSVDVDRLVVSNTFGFGVLRNRVARLWLGPQLVLAGGASDDNYTEAEIGLGAVIGVNLHVGRRISLGPELGGRISAFAWDDSDNEGGDGSRAQIFANFSVLFRIGDSFER